MMIERRDLMWLLAVAGVVIVVIYGLFDPVVWGSYFPACAIHKVFGISCPSCGTQRALHALLQGDFKEAISYNYFVFVTIAYIIGLGIASFTYKRDNRLARFFYGYPGAVTYITLYLLWFLLRNLINL